MLPPRLVVVFHDVGSLLALEPRVEILGPLAGTLGGAGRGQPEVVHVVGVLLPLADEDRNPWRCRQELGQHVWYLRPLRFSVLPLPAVPVRLRKLLVFGPFDHEIGLTVLVLIDV